LCVLTIILDYLTTVNGGLDFPNAIDKKQDSPMGFH